jgi:[acyl-carrier-protein] S-malonyltransferase
MNHFALLCSGQGSQSPELFARFPFSQKGLELKREILENHCLASEVAAWLEDPRSDPNIIYDDHYAQPLLGLFQAMVWAELGERLPKPKLVAGYSFGELSAYGCSGALRPEQVVSLASARAQYMDAAAKPGTLIAVKGVSVKNAATIAADYGGYVAIIISDNHSVLGCLAEQTTALALALRTVAHTVVPLKVTIPSHTPLLDSAVEPFRRALLAQPCHSFKFPVLAGVNAGEVVTENQMRQWLPEQIHRTVRWDLVLSRLRESDCRVLLEIGSGTELVRMVLAENFTSQARSISEFRTVDGIVAWVEKALDRVSS